MEKENKKGSMTAKQLVSIILLLVGFAILLFVFYQINWSGQIDRQVCHQSVVLRATAPMVAQNFVPLKCATTKVCATSGIIGGKCETEFKNAKAITKVKVKNVEQVEKLVAQEIIDCWTMMGEGKVSLFSQHLAERFGIGGVYPSCVICSRIAFDDKIDFDLDEMNVLDYMITHKVPDEDVSYYNYLAKEGGKINTGESLEVKDIIEVDGELEVSEGGETINVNELEEPLKDKEEMAVLFMQISSPSHGDSILNIGKAALGIGAVGGYFAGPSLIAKGIKAVGLKGGLISLAAAIIGAGAQQLSVVNSRGVAAGYCGDISVGKEARDGCSVIRTVKYNLEEIKKYCSEIESIS